MHMRGEGVHRMGTNLCASDRPRFELLHAQGFMSKSLTVASEYSTENPSFSEIRILPNFTSFSCMKMCKCVQFIIIICVVQTVLQISPDVFSFSQRFRSNSEKSLFETLCVRKFSPRTGIRSLKRNSPYAHSK